ncbi:hypothetical protein [Caballeronia sp. DA-9]|uniref:hypothetical protein n=1 Tax=Caballeronia sp. DA-9 TaxID=3436237 RepID=UPI003F678E56
MQPLRNLFLGIVLAVAPMVGRCIDISIPGGGRICDTCGGGLIPGSNIGPVNPLDPFATVHDLATALNDPSAIQAAANLQAFEKVLPKDMQIAIANTLRFGDKAVSDVAMNLAKSANDVVDAAHAAARFAEREGHSQAETLTNAEQRIRDGKVVDALWHYGTEGAQATDKNAAQAAQENELLATAAQAVATAYGGPAGAAAFAAWRTYHSSGGNVELSLKAGAYAYAMSAGNTAAGKMPSTSLDAVARKAAMTGAVGGLAVAASGGSTEETLKAFVDSGGAVLVQAGQSYVKKNYSSVGSSKLDQYCVTAAGRRCADAKQWYGKAKTRLDQLNEMKQDLATLTTTDDGNWSISWDKTAIGSNAKDVPAIALTYVGDGSPFKNTINRIAALSNPVKFANTWVAFRDVGASSSFFSYADPQRNGSLPKVGDEIIANRAINIRSSPAHWASGARVLPQGSHLRIIEMRTLYGNGKPQEWVRFQESYLNAKD